uniref:Uncharacterized protein n=1 Tax=Tanacetum cinerariifolium TaxID=118510 RepID=A0A6L2JSI9_TANCI|nr:hypothetical protein [Tanacetum cinerariifolium]
MTNAKKLIGVFMSSSNKVIGLGVRGRSGFLNQSALEPPCQCVVHHCYPCQTLDYVALLSHQLSFSKMVTLSLNLNTYEKSKSAGNEVVASEVVGVKVGVACCRRGLKKIGGEGIVMVKMDVISGIAAIGIV